MVRDSREGWEGCLKLLKEKQKIKEMQKIILKRFLTQPTIPTLPIYTYKYLDELIKSKKLKSVYLV
jgi:hypothetical protein